MENGANFSVCERSFSMILSLKTSFKVDFSPLRPTCSPNTQWLLSSVTFLNDVNIVMVTYSFSVTSSSRKG